MCALDYLCENYGYNCIIDIPVLIEMKGVHAVWNIGGSKAVIRNRTDIATEEDSGGLVDYAREKLVNGGATVVTAIDEADYMLIITFEKVGSSTFFPIIRNFGKSKYFSEISLIDMGPVRTRDY